MEMTNFLAVLLVAICSSVACAQSGGDVELLNSSIPRPYASLGPSVTEDAGYAPLAYRAESGLDLESKHAIFRALAAYDNGHKTDDGDQPNVNGHDRYLESAAYFRAGHGWSFGMGWRWNQLSTANYSKDGSRPEFGGSYDWFLHPCSSCRRAFSMRFDADWVTAGTDRQNGSHGPTAALWFPAPSEKRHLFWRQTVSIYRFHESVTEPNNLSLTQQQTAQKHFDSTADFAVIYRF
jgi:hypothetical protein